MTHAAESTRRFRVYARHVDHHHARTVEEVSFEAAAIAYIEFDVPAPAGDDADVRVIVHEIATGHERCFTLDLVLGEASPCG
jgi:hypothetical protein